MSTRPLSLAALLDRRILVLDGAMGTMVQRRRPREADFRGTRFAAPPARPQGRQRPPGAHAPGRHPRDPRRVPGSRRRHHRDVDLQRHRHRPGRLRPRGPRLRDQRGRAPAGARQAADDWTARTPDKPRFVAGAIGPTNKTLSLSPDVNDPAFRAVTFDQVRDAYAEQVRGLIDGGCDVLLIETIFDTLNAKAAIVAAREVFEEKGVELPVMMSVTITDKSGRTLSGQTVDAFWVSVAHARPLERRASTAPSAPARCARTSSSLLASGQHARQLLSQRGAARTPSASTTSSRPTRPRRWSASFALDGLVNIVGGCCGTTPDHIRAIAAAVDGMAPPRRIDAGVDRFTQYSGLEDADHPPGQQLPDGWRADQRHRLRAVPSA